MTYFGFRFSCRFMLPAVLLVVHAAGATDVNAFDSALEGQWCFIADESDDVRERVADTLLTVDTRVKTVMRRGERGSRPQVRALLTRAPTEQEVDEVVAYLESVVPASPLARIEREAERVTLTYADGSTREVCVNCANTRETVQSTATDSDQELVIASWIGGTLTVETNTNRGVSAVEVYKVDRKGGLLNAQLEIKTPRLPHRIQIRHVYSPAGKRKSC